MACALPGSGYAMKYTYGFALAGSFVDRYGWLACGDFERVRWIGRALQKTHARNSTMSLTDALLQARSGRKIRRSRTGYLPDPRRLCRRCTCRAPDLRRVRKSRLLVERGNQFVGDLRRHVLHHAIDNLAVLVLHEREQVRVIAMDAARGIRRGFERRDGTSQAMA